MAVKDQTILKNHYYYIRDTKILSKLKLSHFILYLISHPLEEELLLKKIQVLRYNIQRGQIRQKKNFFGFEMSREQDHSRYRGGMMRYYLKN